MKRGIKEQSADATFTLRDKAASYRPPKIPLPAYQTFLETKIAEKIQKIHYFSCFKYILSGSIFLLDFEEAV
jgi:hypothetical protein